MASSRHLQIINPSYSNGDFVDTFRYFPRLTIELRLRIWQLAIKQHRLLEIEVEATSKDNLNGQKYNATVKAFQLHSKLLFVNRESREVALKFYRVHILCYLQRVENGITRTRRSFLYFNPEWDFVHLNLSHGLESGNAVASFFHDLKVTDPRGIGLLNLALSHNNMLHLQSYVDMTEARLNASLVATLSQLRNLIWVAQSHAPRGIFGLLHGFQGIGVQFSHSMPIKSNKPSFNLLSRDPRPVGPELKSVLTGASDPRRMRVMWREVLKKCGISQTQPTKERVLFAFEPTQWDLPISNITEANQFVKEEEEKWLSYQEQKKNLIKKFARKAPIESPEELANAVRPAIGFWLFPAEALGSIDEEFKSMKSSFDMTGYWPELALSSLF